MVDDNARFGQDGTGALEVNALAQQSGEPTGDQAVFTAEEQASLRDTFIKANPHLPASLISGTTLPEFITSVRNAEAAYHAVQAQQAAAVPTSAGGGVRSETAVDPVVSAMQRGGKLDPLTMISLGLATNHGPGYREAHGMGGVNDTRAAR